MRLLILTDRFPPHDRGGAERIAYYHAQAMREEGWEVGVLTGMPPRSSAREVGDSGTAVFRGYTFPQTRVGVTAQAAVGALYNPIAAGAVRRAIRDFRPDVIHAHLTARISLAAAAQSSAQYPTVITFHGYHFECPKGGLYRKRGEICVAKPVQCKMYAAWNLRGLSRIRRIIAISRFIEERLLTTGFDRGRVLYLPNGVPGIEERAACPLPGSHRILYAGVLEAHKGVASLIRAFLRISGENVSLTIAGHGRERAKLESLAGGDRRILFVGWHSHEDLRALYQESQIVAVPSLWHEVMNTVICEAQSWSRPVVASAVGGNRDLIEDGVSGLLYPPGDESALASALSRLLDNHAEAQLLASNGFRSVKQLSMNRHKQALLSLYRTILDERH
ncbi:MAG: glycosyltransferase [Terracidiphilus sp.]